MAREACFVIEGGRRLRGEVRPGGNKNAALPLIAATLLTDEPVILRNVPRIRDVRTMLQLLSDLGAVIEELDPHTLRIDTRGVRPRPLNPELCRDIRASILLAGPLLTRFGYVEMPPPGGDVIGRRRLDTHFLAFEALGARYDVNRIFRIQAPSRLCGADILLDEASVTATENTVMAAVLARGTTVLRNAASEPHVQALCHFLNRIGASIEGIGSNTLVIHGVERLGGGEWEIESDHIEVGSFIGLAALVGDGIWIRRAVPHHLRMVQLVYRRLGIHFEVHGEDIYVPPEQPLQIVPDIGGHIPKIEDAPWPGFPADLMSIAIVVATQARGPVLFHEKMFESRLYFVDKLIAMGARIVLCDPHRCLVHGPSPLHGERLESPDIRAGMALVIAALCAEGTSVIRNIVQIDRGYEDLDGKLRALGAAIERVER
ncbi:MAG TPA: UDP-N-acetylglucosamine 1-carboxyvinyltransferase [Thermoflexus sp.]|nr:UDP-N-acetylglucosamine 1-carboxyvinyltransferase [Thermoflexus sp.]